MKAVRIALVAGLLAGLPACSPSVPPYKNLAEEPVSSTESTKPGPAADAPIVDAPRASRPAIEANQTPDGAIGPLDGREGRDLALDQFRPIPQLKVPANILPGAKFPCIDVHVHPKVRLRGSPELLDEYVRVMDAHNIALSVSLDGGLGEALDEHMAYLWTKHRERFLIFATIDWRGGGSPDDMSSWDFHRPDFVRRTVALLEQAKEKGVSGLKLFKEFGLTLRNADGSLLQIDDSRWDPIWEACGRLGLPVIMHTADPSAFFLPIDNTNERWEELHRHPEWSFHGPQFPRRAELLAARNRVVGRHRGTTFIAAHMANDAEDLAEAARWLDEHPNLVTEIAARIADLGRQPFTAREFFLKYADRILFGTDGPRVPERLGYHWRLLETRDEYFPYAENPFPPQGFWRIYGLDLPDDVLKKVYFENALRLIPGAREKYERHTSAR